MVERQKYIKELITRLKTDASNQYIIVTKWSELFKISTFNNVDLLEIIVIHKANS